MQVLTKFVAPAGVGSPADSLRRNLLDGSVPKRAIRTCESDGNATDDAANIAWSRSGWESAEPYGHEDRIYLNFSGHGEDADLTQKAFGDNYARLARIKAHYDPGNTFRFNQNIAQEA